MVWLLAWTHCIVWLYVTDNCARCGRKHYWLVAVSLLVEARAGLAAVDENCCDKEQFSVAAGETVNDHN
jgi:hypothetical protein